jgi:hypothetical protein
MYHCLENHFGGTQRNSLVTWVMWNLVSVCLEILLVSMQDRSIFCTERTLGSDWMHPMVLLGDEAQVETHFGLFGDSANLEAR